MSEIKIRVEIPQFDVLITAIEHLANARGENATLSVETTSDSHIVESKTNKPAPKPQEKIPQSETENQYTIEDVRAVFMKCAKAHGKDKVKKILAELGVAKVTEIKQEDFARAVKAVEEVK